MRRRDTVSEASIVLYPSRTNSSRARALSAALLQSSALLGPALALSYARAYTQAACVGSSTPIDGATTFSCTVSSTAQSRPQVFYTGYGMWYDSNRTPKDSQPSLPLTLTSTADIAVSGVFTTLAPYAGTSRYVAPLPEGNFSSGPGIQITSLSGGILAFNEGSDNENSGNDVSGGAGAPVTVTSSGTITSEGFGIAAYDRGGHGSKAGDSLEAAGDGGGGGAVQIDVSGDVTASQGPGVFAASYGGGGGRTGKLGRGGEAGAVALSFGTVSVSSSSTAPLFQGSPIVSGSAAAAISYGGDAYRDDRGNASAVTISAASGTSFSTGGVVAPALLALSYGGVGNGSGYQGGAAGTAFVSLTGDGRISTTGTRSPGIVVQSLGGLGQSKEVSSSKETEAKGGMAAATTVSNGFDIATSGMQSHGIVAQSAGAGGGIFAYDGSGALTWGDQNTGSYGGEAVKIANTGAISTSGPDAHGILAQSVGGGGHVDIGPDAGSVTVGGSAASVSGNDVSVSNSGDITTLGQSYTLSSGSASGAAYGGGVAILAQSIGGGGGTMAGGTGRLGGKGAGSTGGTVVVSNGAAALSTAGSEAHGILTQSIGGGGGQGRNSTGLFVAVGGTGGAGGNGSMAEASNQGAITVNGDYANGVMVQSIGGGGGAGGKARAIGLWGITVADAHGGSGGAGGAGGAAQASSYAGGSIVSRGLNGAGMVVQSIGGGGGSGGAAKSTSVGVVSVALTFGGSGGGGGAGGAARATVNGALATYGYDSLGVISQSIGGGGGQGGTASANSFAVGVPLGPDGPTLSTAVSVAHGGSGGTASAGGAASALNADSTARSLTQTVQTSSNRNDPTTGVVSLMTVPAGATYSGITTFGDNSTGILVQSIGGGGGAGGDATASSSAGVLQNQLKKIQSAGDADDIDTINLAIDVALGGTAGGGGAGGTALATNSGGVTTFGLFADGMVAQSIGGGGGQGGAGNAKTTAVGDASVGLNLAIGASGGAGGDGGAATAANALGGIIVTGGNNSRGVLVQSIGAGGGNGGGGGGSTSSSFGLSIGLGSSGATGGAGGAVTAWNYGAVTTRGDWSDGLLAQSIGGGGGNGGAGDSSLTVTSGQKFDDSYAASGQYSSTGAATNGAQSKPTSDTFTMSLGTTGGGGGDAGAVVVGANAPADDIAAFWSPGVGPSTILTFGNLSHGLSAQSIGGGGGNAAIAPASSSAVATLDIGARGAGGGTGGKVFVYASNIATSGFSSHGVLAQSVGGGGGMGVASGVATTITTRLGSENVALETGSGAGSSNDGGGVYVTTQPGSTISTGGPVTVAGITSSATDAFGILAQSIGGGGRLGGGGHGRRDLLFRPRDEGKP